MAEPLILEDGSEVIGGDETTMIVRRPDGSQAAVPRTASPTLQLEPVSITAGTAAPVQLDPVEISPNRLSAAHETSPGGTGEGFLRFVEAVASPIETLQGIGQGAAELVSPLLQPADQEFLRQRGVIGSGEAPAPALQLDPVTITAGEPQPAAVTERPFVAAQAAAPVASIPGSAENPVISQPQLVSGTQTATTVRQQSSGLSPEFMQQAREVQAARQKQAQETERLGAIRQDASRERSQRLLERSTSLVGQQVLEQQDLDQMDQELATLKQKTDTMRTEVQGETVDRGRWWANRTTGSKVLAVVGLILGAAGSGGRNRAAEQLQKIIDADVQDQVRNINLRRANLNDFQQQVKNLTSDRQAQQAFLTSLAKEQAAAEIERMAAEAGGAEAASLAQIEAQKLRADAAIGYQAAQQAQASKTTIERRTTPVAKQVGGKQVARELAVQTDILRRFGGGRSMQAPTKVASKEIRDQVTVSDQQRELLSEYKRALQDWLNASSVDRLAPRTGLNQALAGLRTIIGTKAAKEADPGSVVREHEAQSFAQATLGNDPREVLSTANASLTQVDRALTRMERGLQIFVKRRLVPTTPQATIAPTAGRTGLERVR